MKSVTSRSILLTWELGDELGHLARLRPVAMELQRRGHQVVVATSQPDKLAVLPVSIPVVSAPSPRLAEVPDPIREPATFADVLYNAGVTQHGALQGVVRDWRVIFEETRPDVVVQDYSPFTLLALQGEATSSMLLGTGFACPPDTARLPDIRAWQNHYPDRLAMTERAVLEALNGHLENHGQADLQGIGELYTRVDANLLATFPELDHYPGRQGARGPSPEHVGVWSDLGGEPPRWPQGEGPRVFAYLKAFRALPRLLDHLAKSGFPCLVFTKADIDRNRWRSASLEIVSRPLDMRRVVRECDLGILHAGHGSTAQLLLGGRPILQLPLNVEQYHTAKNTERLGAGTMVLVDQADAICKAFDRVASGGSMRKAAAGFASRHAAFSDERALAKVVDTIERLAAQAA